MSWRARGWRRPATLARSLAPPTYQSSVAVSRRGSITPMNGRWPTPAPRRARASVSLAWATLCTTCRWRLSTSARTRSRRSTRSTRGRYRWRRPASMCERYRSGRRGWTPAWPSTTFRPTRCWSGSYSSAPRERTSSRRGLSPRGVASWWPRGRTVTRNCTTSRATNAVGS